MTKNEVSSGVNKWLESTNENYNNMMIASPPSSSLSSLAPNFQTPVEGDRDAQFRSVTECSITRCDTVADITSIVVIIIIIITPCDIGNAVWVDYSCILSLVQSLLRQSSSFPKDIHSTGDDDYVKEEQ